MYNLTSRQPDFLPHLRSDISLSLEKGQCLILVGENGIGKSSLLRRIAQDYAPKFSLSFVEQNSLDIFYDRSLAQCKKMLLSVQENVLDKKRFLRLWELFNFESKGQHLLSGLSGGEGQILKLICGLSVEADLFLLDEPTQYLDLNNQKKLNELIRSLQAENKSFLIVEHDLKWLPKEIPVQEVIVMDSVLKIGKTWTT